MMHACIAFVMVVFFCASCTTFDISLEFFILSRDFLRDGISDNGIVNFVYWGRIEI